MEKEIKIPNNLNEAIKALDEELVEEDKQYILENGAISVHHSLGRWIRNNWGLWTSSELKNEIRRETGLFDADDISNYIIKKYIKHLKDVNT